MEMLLSPLIGKLLGAIALLGALVAAYFGIKRKGVTEEKQRQELKQAEARQELQQKVDEARSGDAQIEAKAEKKIEQATAEHPKPADPPGGYKPGDIFKFVFIILLAQGCAYFAPKPPAVGVAIDIPARPRLPQCPAKPEVTGKVVQGESGLEVATPIDDARKLAGWSAEFPMCAIIRETYLDAHIEKLENRLKAVGGR